jgi:hypothetical protein
VQPSFLRVAHRSLEAAEAVLARAVQEKAGFLAYHAFESVGGAYCTARQVPYHPASHPEKIRRFVRASHNERFAQAASALALEVAALRNLLLYPRRLPDGSVRRPEAIMTPAQARRLVGRIRTFVGQIERVL